MFHGSWKADHLAQVATLLTQAGVEPPPVDYMPWVRAGRPGVTP
jgi:uncharacterized damage-inducible protein DinB